TPLTINQWHHVLVRYDGSGKADQIKFYVDGLLQGSRVGTDSGTLTGTIRTEVPFKVGQRNKRTLLNEAMIADVRIYTRELSADEIQHLAKDILTAWLARTPAHQ